MLILSIPQCLDSLIHCSNYWIACRFLSPIPFLPLLLEGLFLKSDRVTPLICGLKKLGLCSQFPELKLLTIILRMAFRQES